MWTVARNVFVTDRSIPLLRCQGNHSGLSIHVHIALERGLFFTDVFTVALTAIESEFFSELLFVNRLRLLAFFLLHCLGLGQDSTW